MQGKVWPYFLALHSCPLLSTASCTSHSWYQQIVSNPVVQRSRVSCNAYGIFPINCLAKLIARQSDSRPVVSRELGLSAVRRVQGAVQGLFPGLLGLAGQLVQAGQAAPQAAGTHLYNLLFTCCTPAGTAAQHRRVWCHCQIKMLTCTPLYSLVVVVLTQMYSVACASVSRLGTATPLLCCRSS